MPSAAEFHPTNVTPALRKLVGEGRLKVPFPVPVVLIEDGTVPESPPFKLNEIVALHWA